MSKSNNVLTVLVVAPLGVTKPRSVVIAVWIYIYIKGGNVVAIMDWAI